MAKPFRFFTGPGAVSSPEKLLRAARRAEDLGYSSFVMADHFMMPMAPLVALQAVAEATSTLRLSQLVLAHGFRHPAVLAKELATLDVLSGGRVEIGLGAGWMAQEYQQAGIPFPRPGVRIEQLEEVVQILEGLFGDGPFTFEGRHFTITDLEGTPKPVQRPHPPLMIGGGGPKVLALAARRADIVQVLARPNPNEPVATEAVATAPYRDPGAITRSAYAEKVEWIRANAGERFGEIELATILFHLAVTDDVERAEEELLGRFRAAGSAGGIDPEEILGSPVVAIGSVERVCDKLRQVREELGFSYLGPPVGVRPEVMAPVIERLAGT